MFFKLLKHRILSTKIAQHIKVPYVGKTINIYQIELKHYNNIYNSIYYAEKDNRRTYFYIKSNLLKYYNAVSRPIFKLDIVNEKYEMFDLRNIKYVNRDPKSIVIVTEQGKKYLVSDNLEYEGKSGYVAIIDITSGEQMYIKQRKGEDVDLYFHFMRPIGNSIVPIIRIQSKYIQVDLVDISNSKNYHISWSIEDIRYEILEQAVSAVDEDEDNVHKDLPHAIDTILRYKSMQHIKRIEVKSIQYKYANYENNTNYVKEAVIYFDLVCDFAENLECYLDNVILRIKLDLDYDYIKLYLDFNEAKLIVGSYSDDLKDCLYEKESIYERFDYSGMIYNNNISDTIYSNNCCVISYNTDGISISKTVSKKQKKSSKSYQETKIARLYRYKEYLFILRGEGNEDLAILNTKRNSIAFWSPSIDQINCVATVPNFIFYYLDKVEAFIFLSVASECLFFIDKKNMDNILNQENSCVEVPNGIIKVFNLNRIMPRLISNYHSGKSIEVDNIKGHCLNKKTNSLYIIVSYNVNRVEYIGLFECKILKDKFKIDLLDYVSPSKIYGSRHLKEIDLGKIKIHGIKVSSLKELELAYNNNNRIVSIKHNRQSINLRFIMKEHFEVPKIKRRNIFPYNGLIIIQHVVHEGVEEVYPDYGTLFGFIVSELHVVNKWGT